MQWPSLTVILSAATAAYVAHSVWTLASLFYPTPCPDGAKCFTSYLRNDPPLQLKVFTSSKYNPKSEKDLTHVLTVEKLNLTDTFEKTVNVSIPAATRNNGSLYCVVFLLAPGARLFTSDQRSATVSVRTTVTTFTPLQADTFNLIGGAGQEEHESKLRERPREPVTHWRSRMTVNVMTEDIAFEVKNVPGDLYRFIRVSEKMQYLPILYIDDFGYRTRDLMPVNSSSKELPLTVKYEPISVGKLRLWSNMQAAFKTLTDLGFTEKDTDEVKGIFADTNFYFLILTFIVSAVHLLFDFLAFRNDISYWKNRRDMVGLSSKTVVWRCVSTFIIFLYLLDEETSMLVLIPAGIGALIEVWKVKKAFKISVIWKGWRPSFEVGLTTDRERETRELDSQAMKYLSYVLWPLVACGAVYSLIYTPHKSWYSWCVQTLVNGIYAFGFLFMLPQLFLNYKLKSVAHLPWRAFMYKAFNTFIDDIFAFIITMPTAHRLACFRDDVVFLIYLYQRWLYPIDKTRVNEYGQSFEEEETRADSKANHKQRHESKKTQ